MKIAMQIKHLVRSLWNLIEWFWRNHGNLVSVSSFYPTSSLFTLCLCCHRVSWLWLRFKQLEQVRRVTGEFMNEIQFYLEVWRQTAEKSSDRKQEATNGEARACNHLFLPLTCSLTEFWSEASWQRNWRFLILWLFLRSLKINQRFL